jgi:hypothetical protein
VEPILDPHDLVGHTCRGLRGRAHEALVRLDCSPIFGFYGYIDTKGIVANGSGKIRVFAIFLLKYAQPRSREVDAVLRPLFEEAFHGSIPVPIRYYHQ